MNKSLNGYVERKKEIFTLRIKTKMDMSKERKKERKKERITLRIKTEMDMSKKKRNKQRRK